MKIMKQLREDSKGETRLLYHLNYWDGPISGVCLYNGKKCYFSALRDIYDEDDMKMTDDEWIEYCLYLAKGGYIVDKDDRDYNSWYRVFAIYDTPDNIIEILEENHKLFQEHVGTHCDYDFNGRRNINSVKHSSNFDKFYKADKRKAEIKESDWIILDVFVGPY